MLGTMRTRRRTPPGSVLLMGLALLAGSGCERDETVEPVVLVEGAAWTWFNDERALFVDGRLLVGYVDTAGYSGVAVYRDDGTVVRQRLSSFRERDDHNNPSLLDLGDGRVLAAYSPHNTRRRWFWRHGRPATRWPGARSAGPGSWGPAQRTRTCSGWRRRMDGSTTSSGP